jgi:hypothetical protein
MIGNGVGHTGVQTPGGRLVCHSVACS